MKLHDTSNHPLCTTLVFLMGGVLGVGLTHLGTNIKHDLVIIVASTIVFYLTQLKYPKLSFKQFK